MKMKKFAPLLLCVAALLSATACTGEEPENPDETFLRETFAKETYATVEDTRLNLTDALPASLYPSDSSVGVWLAGCVNPDRDDFFDAYVLRHESASEGNTTFTYLVYYPHGVTPLVVTPELLEGESGYVLNLRFSQGDGLEGYSLSRLEVTLPTQKAPHLRLLVGDESLGVLSTVTENPIP